MGGFWYPPDDHAPDRGTFHGSAHSVSAEPPAADAAEAVRKVAEEVTRKPVARPAPRKIGF